MILIANFSSEVNPVELVSEVSARLGENEEEVYLISIRPEIKTNPESYKNSVSNMQYVNGLDMLKFGQPYSLSSRLFYSPEDNLNRIGEQLLSRAGLKDTETGWQDSGPVVIIPPDSPALALFLGHAIVHYLSDVGAWSPLYVVTNLEPLVLLEWD